MGKVWKAREAVIKLASGTAISISSGTALHASFGSGSSTVLDADMKGVEITEPDMAVEKIDLLGVDGNSFQNAEVEEKSAGMAKCTGTLLLRGDETALELLGYESGTAVTGGFTRYQVSNGSRKKVSILLNVDDGTDTVNFVLHDGFLTTKDTKLTGADGHFEQSIELTTLPKNFYKEFKN